MANSVLVRVLTLFLAATALWAQTETGQITGTVSDPTGAVVGSASVKVTNDETGAERVVTTNSSGDFAVTNLQPAQYTVTVQAPGFSSFKQTVPVTVGSKIGLPVKLEVGNTGTTVQVTEATVPVNTETQTLATNVSQQQVRELPTLTRNPYDLVSVSGNVSSAGAGNRGVGYAINGQREASTNVLLDGSANNDEFNARVGQQVPLDSVQEFSVLTNNFTAEFGRASGGIVNVVTKSGSNDFHGTAYEFLRLSRFSSNSFDSNANGVQKPVFTRNQFGYSFGGPIKKDKLFFFSSTEWIRVRSTANDLAVVPSPELIAASSASTQSFFNAYGKFGPSTSVLQTYNNSQANICGKNAACAAFANANPGVPLFDRVLYSIPGDAGGGYPQNHYETNNRVDWNISDRTQVYARYALESINYFPGFVSASPYNGYNTGETDFNNNALVSVTKTITPTFVSQSKAVFNRLNQQQPFGTAGANIPTLYTGSSGATTLLNQTVLMPGYVPNAPGSGIPFGGPQNFVQLYQDFSLSVGKHQLRFGGSYDYQRDNRTFGAYQTGGYYLGAGAGTTGGTVANLLAGTAYEFQAAVYPQGQLPGATVNLPLTQPNFSRSNRYNEGAVYVQDSWKLIPRFTLNLGLRWEYFGVQHNKDPQLDSNFYDPANQIDTPLGIREGTVQLAPNAGGLWKPSDTNFAPRVGFAWDVTGDGKTAIRGGYGIAYERNFGNVTFNVIQNPPNYQTVQIFNNTDGTPIQISPANFGPFSGTSGTVKLPRASLRNVDYNIRQAYSHLWSFTVERQISGSVTVGLDYTGSRGVHLYDIEVLNRRGYGNYFLGDPCQANGGTGACTSYLNNQYSGINRRGDKGWSNYNGLNARINTRDVGHSGVTLTAAYTWSHALDNLSSTFSDSDAFSNNNGQFNTGYLDPYAPMLDKGSSDFDIRQRISVTAVWDIPAFRDGKGIKRQVLGGWQLAPIFIARSGSPYSIFDSSNPTLTDTPRAVFGGPVSVNGNGTLPLQAPNQFSFLTIPTSSISSYTSPYGYADLPPFSPGMSGRNSFRAPGFWELDLGAYKSLALTERFNLQLRAEAYNLMNHANLYVNGSGADLANGNIITACRGCTGSVADRRNLQLALKLLF